MNEHDPRFRGIDDYVAAFTVEERAELTKAKEELDLAVLMYRMRQGRGLSQVAAAEKSGLKQQAISRLERSPSNVRFNTIGRYSGALGYAASLTIRDSVTGRVIGEMPVASLATSASERAVRRGVKTTGVVREGQRS